MISNPTVGQVVQIWYAAKKRLPDHGRVGVVQIVGTARPRNHAVRLDDRLVVVPAGNLRTPPAVQARPNRDHEG